MPELPSDEAVHEANQAALVAAGYPATVAFIGHKAIIHAYLTQTDEGRALVAGAIPAELAEAIYQTLQYYGNVCTYQGERTGGVLAGCPRGPAPTPDHLVREAQTVLNRWKAAIARQEGEG